MSDFCCDDETDKLGEVCYLNKDEEDEMEIYGYKRSSVRSIVTWIFVILTLGGLRLVFHWYQHFMLYCTHRRCPLKFAQNVLVIDKFQGSHVTYYVKPVNRITLQNLSSEDVEVVGNDLEANGVTYVAGDVGSSVRIYFSDGSYADKRDLIEIKVKKLVYIWRDDKRQFCKLAGIEQGLDKSDLHNMPGYSAQQQLLRRIVYGKNEILVKVDSFGTLFLLEVLNPFYIFQILSLILWFIELYLYYSFAIITMSLFGIILTVVQTRKNQQKLFETVQARGVVTVCRKTGTSKCDAVYEDIPIDHLVPGDIIVIPRSGFVVPCDAVLLSGNCIVNESMLTGESVPVTKTSLPCLNVPYCEKDDSNHTLFCGTQVVQARYYANETILAVVLRTGYLTAKGNLVRSILYPVPHDFKFDQDGYKFVGILGVIAVIGTAYAAYAKIVNDADLFDVIIDSLDIITIVVPPALPAAMSVGKYYAQNRLQKQKITCMNPSVINVSGSVNCVCFDKTGTLTEDGLDLYGVIPTTNQNKLGKLVEDIQGSGLTNFKEAMACCHSLTLISGVISGDPLDVKMFESTGWILDETELTDTLKYDLLAPTIVRSPSEDTEIGIIHQFQFSSRLQRMSVITRHLNSKELTIYCKGSPEMITSLSMPESVPPELDMVLEKQTEKGYRVIAMGYRTFPAIDIIKLKRLQRDDVECNLIFAGLIIFENKLKPQTTSIISDLRQARMKIVMLTGDNIQTAICVAKECGILNKSEILISLNMTKTNGHSEPQLIFTPSQTDMSKFILGKSEIFSISDVELGTRVEKNQKYAMTGSTWSAIRDFYPARIPNILQHGVVFARMSSDQKQQVIQELQAMGYYVAMCGDGANDCGALKTADVGISLSEAESSVASPFVSQQADIACVLKVIKEGRAALVTAFGLFKYMVLYSLLEFFSTVILFTFSSELSDFQFLYIDIFLIVVFAFFFGQTKPYKGRLSPKAPNPSLLSVAPLMSMLLQVMLMFGMQIFSAFLIRKFVWYKPKSCPDGECASYDNYAVYTISQFQYITLAITFSFGKPYREPIYKNVFLFLSLVVMTLVSAFITVCPWSFKDKLFNLKLPPTIDARLLVISLAVISFILSILIESVVMNKLLTAILGLKIKDKTVIQPSYSKTELMKTSIEHLSVIEVKDYGTMKG